MKPLPAPAAAEGLYRAVWCWHFYAGLLVLPFLLLLAATGGLYLFHHEIDAWWHRDLRTVSAGEPVRSHQALVDAALAVQPGRFVRYVPADAPTASAQVDIVSASGDKWMVYVDPPRAQVLGSLPDRGSLMGTVRRLHSLKIVGPVARGLVEMAAGWALLLAATGVYLWWPRGQAGGVVSVRGVPRQRVFWRDVHAVTGSVAALFIVFLAATGMPWSVLWGAQVNQWANGSNLGYPAGVRVAVPMSDEHLDHAAPTAWSLQQARVPLSTDRASAMLGLDAAIALVEARGIAPGYAITPPAGPTGVYSASVYPADLSKQRVIHLDAYSGRPLIDMGYADYGPIGRALEWGINVHLGQEYGAVNRWVLVAACAAIALLCVSAALAVWKRRPAGAWTVPAPKADARRLRQVAGVLAVGGLLFPLVGASMGVIAAADAWGRRLHRQRSRPGPGRADDAQP